MHQLRTDLALESKSHYTTRNGAAPDGVEIEESALGGMNITRVVISSPEGEAALGKPVGTYITAETSKAQMQEAGWIMATAETLAHLLAPLLPPKGDVLIVGLGNRGITPDNLGPKTIDNLIITRHLREKMPGLFGEMRPVCAISTGVLGLTGIETAEIVKGVCNTVSPCCIIAVDALAAADYKRLCTTFQIATSGISPGSGASNPRKELSQKTLGIPVIGVGVPTVIESKTMILNALEGYEPDLDGLEDFQSMLVTPNDIDALIFRCAKAIGYGINLCLFGPMTADEMEQFLI